MPINQADSVRIATPMLRKPAQLIDIVRHGLEAVNTSTRVTRSGFAALRASSIDASSTDFRRSALKSKKPQPITNNQDDKSLRFVATREPEIAAPTVAITNRPRCNSAARQMTEKKRGRTDSLLIGHQ
ncbi:hypothetical protein [Candidatus Poriferisodalis sp.]|uniref:hypothetical protein n=1 Tax=Candidatus Poriferisodalis sp. TaxID=3101277 RepID=UPI003B5B7E01